MAVPDPPPFYTHGVASSCPWYTRVRPFGFNPQPGSSMQVSASALGFWSFGVAGLGIRWGWASYPGSSLRLRFRPSFAPFEVMLSAFLHVGFVFGFPYVPFQLRWKG